MTFLQLNLIITIKKKQFNKFQLIKELFQVKIGCQKITRMII